MFQLAWFVAKIAWIGKVDLPLQVNRQIVGSIEALAAEAIGQHFDSAGSVGASDAARAVFTGIQAPLPVHGVAIGSVRVLAEDLGTVPDFVRESLAGIGIPGTKVLRWEVDDGVPRDVRAFPAISVAVTGTHDTESLHTWWEGLSEHEGLRAEWTCSAAMVEREGAAGAARFAAGKGRHGDFANI